VDETSIGYNGYSILRTGADEHGVTLPLYFKAFGEYKNPIFIYSLVPLIKIFDLSVWTIRLGAALFGLGAAIVVGLIVKESLGGKFAWSGGFILAGLTPWLFALSRVSFEVISLPFFIALAWWSWLKAIQSNSVVWFLLSWSAWGISIFTYPTARLITPVLVIVLLVCYFREIGPVRVRCLVGSVPFALCFLLLLFWSFRNPGSLTARFEEISIWKDHPDTVTWVARFFLNYLQYFSPHFLFLSGDANLRHHTGHGGQLFLFAFPALIAGVAYAWQCRDQASERFALLGFLLFPLAASLTDDRPHALRTVNALPFIVLLVACGFKQLWELLRQQRTVLAIFLTLAALETVIFYHDYFYNYADRARAWFNDGLPQALKIALAQESSGIYYSPGAFSDENFLANQPYIQFLFFGKLDPNTYQQRGMAGFNIYPYQNGVNLPKGSILLLKDGVGVFTASGKALILDSPELPPPTSELINQVRIPSHGVADPPAFRIYRVP
jgi:4-amino-4-deoxy-L-arabinose transferase-like glycosyltransferase